MLGPRYDPFVLNDDPNGKQFKVRDLALDPKLISQEKLHDRLQLLQHLNQSTSRSRMLHTEDAAEMEQLNQQAVQLLESGELGKLSI